MDLNSWMKVRPDGMRLSSAIDLGVAADVAS